MKFTYEGFTSLGVAEKGDIEAKNVGEAAQLLREKGIFAQNLAQEGETFKTVFPGNEVTEMVMPWQDPSDYPSPVAEQHRLETIMEPEPEMTKTIIMPAKEWKRHFRDNLRAIDEVLSHYEKSKDVPKFPAATIKAAKAAAVEELLKQAIMRAVGEAI